MLVIIEKSLVVLSFRCPNLNGQNSKYMLYLNFKLINQLNCMLRISVLLAGYVEQYSHLCNS